ncbi:DNA (Apurinic or apyrimidinic site) lyase, endon uclease [Rasamsonia emersonii CBS 393.64]|uniref:Apurinic-apyrimidinic endonuclease 1 n=1 Tax=Rasamsonia emersonii (strain ATCC 16479 / CBS 393.64 / IMI 116815) TaxID=1408163 RepID=A0A0F4YYB9_RASE3|nr:DNA (Apurinic or apyrimidinic site) lyase, endon uclease [Rasamsonia emersonii CBS 393.64]KKA23105.1 DNA (Apurinic or apyrimidinic site) lyase, endon uclease [Rasamsonia emersonii CBS 393.64]
MPARASRRAPAAAPEPLSSTNSPLNGSKKRDIDDIQGESSPLRRSKRVKTGVGLNLPADEDESTKSPVEDSRAPTDSPSRSKRRSARFTETHVKAEEEDLSRSVKSKRTERSALKKSSSTDNNAEGVVVANEAEEEEKEEIITKKTISRKTKTTEEKETDVMALAPRTQGLRMFVGAHVSAAKGSLSLKSYRCRFHQPLQALGNAFALFLKSQRKWDNPPLQDDHRDQFRKLCADHQYDASKHVLPHGSYLVNLAQEDKAKAKQAYDSFLDDLRRPGSANQTSLSSAISRLAKALTKALSETSTVTPVLETMCGHGTTIGGSLSDFASLLSQIPPEYHSRIGICIDTCHSFAAGYDLVSPAGFKAFMDEFEKVIGLKYLRALHLNDSKAPRGSNRDLHANIGTGFLGLRAFHNVMNEKRFEGLPMILETPIDRPDPSWVAANGGNAEGSDAEAEESDEGSTKKKKNQKKPKQKASKPKKVPMIEDKSVWAREIKLLESLIGMDPESAEFRTLEAQLAEEGRAEREKYQEQYERKLEAEEKKRKKEAEKSREKGQRSLVDMMKGQGGGKKKKRGDDDASSGGETTD